MPMIQTSFPFMSKIIPQNGTKRSISYVAHWTPHDRACHGNGHSTHFQSRSDFEVFRASKGSRTCDYGRWIYHVRVSFCEYWEGYQVDDWFFDYGVNNDGSVSKTPYGYWNDKHEDFESFSEI